jgi:hypothetical protein
MDENIKDNILNLAKKNSKLVELVSEYDYYNTSLTDETLFTKAPGFWARVKQFFLGV